MKKDLILKILASGLFAWTLVANMFLSDPTQCLNRNSASLATPGEGGSGTGGI